MGKGVTGHRPEDAEVFILYDLQWVEHDGLTVHSVLHSSSRVNTYPNDFIACGAIRQGGGRWIDLRSEKLRNVTCLACIARGGTPK